MSVKTAAETQAETIGTEHGRNSAEWYCQGMSTESYRATLEGIEAGDPMVLDGFPTHGLSGEWRDDYSIQNLANDTGTPMDSDEFGDVLNAYDDAYYAEVANAIEVICRYQLEGSES